MKRKIVALVAALLLSLVATSICYAQQTVLAVNIPFAFQVGNHTLPAGEYVVQSCPTGTENMQLIRRIGGDASMFLLSIAVDSKAGKSEPQLIFNRYGQSYFLAQIWTGASQGRQLSKSDREKEVAREEGKTEVALLIHPLSVRP